MSKNKTAKEVHHSTYELLLENELIHINTRDEAEKRYKNSMKTYICYLYRNDYNENGKLIEKYMI